MSDESLKIKIQEIPKPENHLMNGDYTCILTDYFRKIKDTSIILKDLKLLTHWQK
jgi:hypothetical protein